jgi:hypothetical protein
VRGPRVTAEDLASLSGGATGAPTTFVLYFRGSGAFARALRGPGRSIFASEHQVAFRSDPVGFPMVVAALREDASLALAPLAERVGRATLAWYEGQQLARTEEPTLWVGADPPRALATPGARVAASSPSAPHGPAPPRPASAPPSPPAPSATAPSAAWAGIQPVDARKYPDAPAVVLLRRSKHVIGDQPALTEEVDEFVQILTAEGERRGDVDVSYFPPEERIEFLDVEVRRPDGTLVRVDPGSGGEAAPATLGEYRTPARKVFALPSVVPGAVLRMHYRTEWRHFPLPSVILDLPLVEDVPVARHEIEVTVGARRAVHSMVTGLAGVTPETAPTPHGTTYRWRLTDLAPAPPESLALPGATPRVLVSTFADWADFAAWYGRLIRQADQVTPEIEAKAAELTRGLTTPREKAVALYDYVASLRYVAIPLGVNSHRPHAAAQVLKNRYGDCKDKANLLNTLLRTQGIEAQLVLVPRFTDAFDETPGVGFNHALSRIQLGADVVWVDPTDELARFGLLPPGDAGRKVLVVGGAPRLVSLPAPRADDHALALTTRLRPDGPSWAADLSGQAKGYADYALRQAARRAASEIATRPILGELLRPAAGALGLKSQTHTPPLVLGQDFRWQGRGTMAGLESALPGGARLLRAPFWLPRDWEAAVHPRRSGLFVHDGYPLRLEQTVDVELPAGAREVALPEAVEQAQGPLRFKSAWTRDATGVVRARLEIEAARGEIGPAETGAFQDALRRLMGVVAQGVTYVPGARSSAR